MSLPLPNPVSPTSGSFLNRLLRTRDRLKAFSHWAPTTGSLKESEIGLPFVSVMLITYNHEKYIRKALDSVLMQICDFPIEINVIDDASTDSTQEIVREYSERYPDIVNCYFNPVNAGHIATQLNTIRGFRTLRGRYFAILEGDDYWTDTSKLAKQVAFLEGNADFVACAHQTLKVFDDNSRPPEHFLPFKAFQRNVAEMYDLISMGGVFHLSSIVYRNVFHQSPPPCLYDQYSCEVTINMLYGVFGKFHCFAEYMSVYRVHGGGVFSGRTQEKHWRFHLFGFGRFALYLGPRYWCMFARAVRGFSKYALLAPFKTREVATLSSSSWVWFSLHFVVAAFITLACLPYRIVKATIRCYPGGSRGDFWRHPIAHILVLALCLLRKVIRALPDPLVHAIFRAEQRHPRWLAARRAVRDWILSKVKRTGLK